MDFVSSVVATADSPGTLAIVAAAIFAAALIRGFTGFGFALAAVPMLGFALPPDRCVPLVIALQFCAGVADLPRARKMCHWPSLGWLIAGTALGSPLGVAALAGSPPDFARLAIALICGGGTVALLCGFRLRALPRGRATITIGLAAGLCNGLAAMPGPPVVAYYLASPLSARQVRSSLMVFFLATSIVSALSLAGVGLVGDSLLVPLVVGIPLLILGGRLGGMLQRLGTERGHRVSSILVLSGVAATSACQAVWHLLA